MRVGLGCGCVRMPVNPVGALTSKNFAGWILASKRRVPLIVDRCLSDHTPPSRTGSLFRAVLNVSLQPENCDRSRRGCLLGVTKSQLLHHFIKLIAEKCQGFTVPCRPYAGAITAKTFISINVFGINFTTFLLVVASL